MPSSNTCQPVGLTGGGPVAPTYVTCATASSDPVCSTEGWGCCPTNADLPVQCSQVSVPATTTTTTIAPTCGNGGSGGQCQAPELYNGGCGAMVLIANQTCNNGQVCCKHQVDCATLARDSCQPEDTYGGCPAGYVSTPDPNGYCSNSGQACCHEQVDCATLARDSCQPEAGSTQSCPGAYVFDPNGYCNISGQACCHEPVDCTTLAGDSCQPQPPSGGCPGAMVLDPNGYCSNSGQACCESATSTTTTTEAGIGTFGNPLTSTPANPGCGTGQTPTLDCIFPMIADIIYWALMFAFVVAIFLIIYAGIRLTTSGGDPKAVMTARNTLIFAIAGLVLVLSAFFILRLIGYVTGVACIDPSKNPFSFSACQ